MLPCTGLLGRLSSSKISRASGLAKVAVQPTGAAMGRENNKATRTNLPGDLGQA